MPSPLSLRTRVLLLAGLFLGMSLLLYGGSLGNRFVEWDDYALIVENTMVLHPSFSAVLQAFRSFDPELYIPLTVMSYQFDSLIAGIDPWFFHLHNLILHTLNALLVTWLLLQTVRRPWAAVLGGLLFLVHPLNTETVAWASGRKDLLSTLFFLLSLNGFLWLRATGEKKFHRLSLVAFLFGLLAKVNIVVLPLLLPLLDWHAGRSIDRNAYKTYLPYWALSLLFGIIALVGKSKQLGAGSILETVLLSACSTIFTLQHIVLPTQLSVLYPYTRPIGFGSIDLLLSLLAVIVLLVGAWMLRHRSRTIPFWIGFFFLTLLPSFVNFHKGDDLGDIYLTSDRYAYVPLIGIIALLVTGGAKMADRLRKHAPTLSRLSLVLCSVLLLCTLGFLTEKQSHVWRTTETLFRHALSAYPNAQIAHVNIGYFLQRKGLHQEAMNAFRQSLSIRETALAHYNIGVLLTQSNHFDDAIASYKKALALDPRASLAAINIGAVYVRKQMPEEAVAAFEEALRIDPQAIAARFNIGLIRERQGKKEEALTHYAEVLALDPSFVPALIRSAAMYEQLGDNQKALLLLQRVLALDPANAEAEAMLREMSGNGL